MYILSVGQRMRGRSGESKIRVLVTLEDFKIFEQNQCFLPLRTSMIFRSEIQRVSFNFVEIF